MRRYEAVFIIRPDLSQEQMNSVFAQIGQDIEKNQGSVRSSQIWADKRKLSFDITSVGGRVKFNEGMYYLINFDIIPKNISSLRQIWKLNENILRLLIVTIEQKGGQMKPQLMER